MIDSKKATCWYINTVIIFVDERAVGDVLFYTLTLVGFCTAIHPQDVTD